MEYRHEWKHELNAADRLELRQRLRAVMEPDRHGAGGKYLVRSLYFDDPGDRALWEKLDGVDRREKFRLRCYDMDFSLIRLEKKCKRHGLSAKSEEKLTQAEVRALLDGCPERMAEDGRPLVRELYGKMCTQGLRPRTVVDYTREAFVFAPGNVRVTLDYDIRTGLKSTDFLNPGCVTVPAGDARVILEVKWDSFLPDLIRDAVQVAGRHTCSFSKYAACRLYG